MVTYNDVLGRDENKCNQYYITILLDSFTTVVSTTTEGGMPGKYITWNSSFDMPNRIFNFFLYRIDLLKTFALKDDVYNAYFLWFPFGFL